MNLEFITSNKNKFDELKHFFPDLTHNDFDLIEIQDIDPKNILKHKLLEANKIKNSNYIVEDTSLYLNCLSGLPGPFIKYFLQTIGNKGLYKVASDYNNFKAIAVCTIGLNYDDNLQYFQGILEGTISEEKGSNGFGWDMIFIPKGSNKTFAEMDTIEKNNFSMRSIAASKLKTYLDRMDYV